MDPLGTKAIAETVAQVVPQVTQALGQAEDAAKGLAEDLESTVTQITDKGLAAVADAVSQLESLVYRLDGATLELEGVSVTSPVKVTFRLGPYKPE